VSEAAPRIVPLGEAAWTVVLGDTVDRALHRRVLELADLIVAKPTPGVIEVVPAYAALTVFFDPLITPGHLLRNHLAELSQVLPAAQPSGGESTTLDPPTGPPGSQPAPLVTIPVVYDGPDLAEVSEQTGLSRESVVRMHSEREYIVYMLGFVPGFAYLGDLHPALVIPRRASPRTRVPAGSVAIAGAQTSVYPLSTPGGWHLIGSTPLLLFDPARNPPALLTPGTRVRFEPAA
jgi:inhibitor of KinA